MTEIAEYSIIEVVSFRRIFKFLIFRYKCISRTYVSLTGKAMENE